MKKTGKKLIGVLAILSAVFCFSSCDAFFQALTSTGTGSDSSDSSVSASEKVSTESVSVEEGSASETTGDSSQSASDSQEENSQSSVHSSSEEKESSPQGGGEEPPIEPLTVSLKAPETKYGYQALAKDEDGEGLCAFYTETYDGLASFFLSDEDLVPVSAGNTQVYRIGEFDYGAHGLTQAMASSVLKTIRLDYPEFYWLDNTFYHGGSKLYLQVDAEYAMATARRKIESGLQTLVDECGAYLDGLTAQTEKALTIYDFVTATLTYAYEEDGVTPVADAWAHNLEGWTTGKGVCETYAEAYAWLCEIYAVPCITVVGVAGNSVDSMGGHAWNITGIDGKWYAVDATWGDQDKNEFLFREWFGKDPTEFAQTHIADESEDWGKNWQVELPALAEESLSPVYLIENDGEKTAYANPDYAFAQMRNAGSRYEMKLYPDSPVTADKGIRIYPKGAVFTTAKLPTVEKITLSAKIVWEGTGEDKKGYMPELTAINEITIACTLALSEIKLTVPAVTGEAFVVKNDKNATLVIKNEENS